MSVKRNDGKSLEKVIRLIQEALKDSPNTKIYSNFKKENQEGVKREFDIFIVSSVNDVPIEIAIECKSFKKPVGVEKVEAFNSKCDRIPSISKRLFVSESGYQRDAINAAKRFGIVLCDLKSISKELILNQFPIDQLGLRFKIAQFSLVIDTTEQELDKVKNEKFHTLHFEDKSKQPVTFIDMINEVIKTTGRNDLWNVNLNEFILNGGSRHLGKVTTVNIGIGLKDCFIISENQTKLPVMGVEAAIDSWLEKTDLNVTASNSFALSDETKANHITVEDKRSSDKLDVVITRDKLKIFHTGKDGTTTEFGLLGVYDPKTGTYQKANGAG